MASIINDVVMVYAAGRHDVIRCLGYHKEAAKCRQNRDVIVAISRDVIDDDVTPSIVFRITTGLPIGSEKADNIVMSLG